MRKISIAITTYNRYTQTINSFAQVLDDERVSEVVISDDCSTDDSCEKLVEYFKGNEKVKIYRNRKNLDCYRNKRIAMGYVQNDFAALIDSDNTITKDYIDAIYAVKWDEKTILQPEFASPHFDFRKWRGLTLTRENVAQYIDTHLMTSLNAQNHFVNRAEYIKVWNGTLDPVTSDSIFFSMCWLSEGNKIKITPNLQYEHFIDPTGKGHYQENYKRTGNFHQVVLTKIKQLK